MALTGFRTLRLPIYQGVCTTFLVPLLAMKNQVGWKCKKSGGNYKDICDVISENVPFCGANIVGPDQTPRIMRGV